MIEIKFIEKFSDAQPFFTDTEIVAGQAYSVIELIKRMLIHSDNQAADLLFHAVQSEQDIWEKLFDELGLQLKIENERIDNEMTVKQMSLFFRVLYNATYLNRDMSELALELLSESTFKEGFKKSVNNDIFVACKYGERELKDTCQLHECGIFYYNDNPYLLCVMTKGANYEALLPVLTNVSKTVYKEMKAQFPSEQ